MSQYAVLQGRIQQQLQDLALEYDYTQEQANLAHRTGLMPTGLPPDLDYRDFTQALKKSLNRLPGL